MARKVIWTESAWKDLEEVVDYIAKDSSHYAAALFVKHGMRHGHWPIFLSGAVQSLNLTIRVSVSFL
jgi:hypothetical protein